MNDNLNSSRRTFLKGAAAVAGSLDSTDLRAAVARLRARPS